MQNAKCCNFPPESECTVHHYSDVLAIHYVGIAGLHCRREGWRRARVTLLIAQCSGLWSRPICCRASGGRHFYKARDFCNLWELPNSSLCGCLPAGAEKAQSVLVNIRPDCFIVRSEKTDFREEGRLNWAHILNHFH